MSLPDNNLSNQAICVTEGSKSQSGLSGRAEGSLFIPTAVTLQDYEHNDLLFSENPLVKELVMLGYSPTSINSMLRCGEESRMCLRECGCGKWVECVYYRCNLRTCEKCSKIRAGKIKDKLLPFLYSQKRDSLNQLYFLTLSPRNYEDLEFGLKDIKKNFNKWKRHEYLKQRIKAGLYIVEVIQTWKGKPQYDKDGNFLYVHEKDGWNIHFHILLYGRRLDNKIRGKCLDCGQNQMSFDRYNHEFYCSNHKCQSRDVLVKQPKLNILWEESTGTRAHFHIRRIDSVKKALNYVLTYVTTDKNEFRDEKGLARYIKAIHTKRLISPFGEFTKVKIPTPPRFHVCRRCGFEVKYTFDELLIWEFLYKPLMKGSPPDLPLVIEYVKISERRCE